MSRLFSIKNDLQYVVESIQGITGVDITVVDEKLLRVAGTGPLKHQINSSAPAKSAFDLALKTGKHYYIETPSENIVCRDCEGRFNCREKAELCIPINLEGETLGVLGMCVFDDETRTVFIKNYKSYLQFQTRLSDIIASMLRERQYRTQLQYQSSQISTLLDAFDAGIIILENDNRILSINEHLSRLFKISPHEQTSLVQLIPPKFLRQIQTSNFCGRFGPASIMGKEYFIEVNPVVSNQQTVGSIMIFTDFDKMQKSVLTAVNSSSRVSFNQIIGQSPLLLETVRQAQRVAPTNASVLLHGESGTGKEIFAHAIHHASHRQENVFVPVNCGAIPEALIESELFGYEKGAFTGALPTGKLGKFEISKDGTLFFDEIGDLPYPTQVKLLRAIEEKEITRLGGSLSLRVNPRIICATHRNLSELVKKKEFREDLFYRLNVVPITIPPLRDRSEDVLLLANHYLAKYSDEYDRNCSGFDSKSSLFLQSYPFPGNIRELRNMIEYAVIFSDSELVSEELLRAKAESTTTATEQVRASQANDLSPEVQSLSQMTRQYEQNIIKSLLQAKGNTPESRQDICDTLGISIASLYRKLSE